MTSAVFENKPFEKYHTFHSPGFIGTIKDSMLKQKNIWAYSTCLTVAFMHQKQFYQQLTQ